MLDKRDNMLFSMPVFILGAPCLLVRPNLVRSLYSNLDIFLSEFKGKGYPYDFYRFYEIGLLCAKSSSSTLSSISGVSRAFGCGNFFRSAGNEIGNSDYQAVQAGCGA